ncbi:hypothetical protein PLEOSDRAFT_1105121 [Pleurotus ostreatus PC15]|uniref:DUF6535 domain-containing protein n=1 Tax=Pleurotus ostreatus (strain PC15) TaxID=1137138 RepID=A0A067NK59_PLEO1|nr:hypothetical protein PLEOSDRAFT_1105121 [Pleurotus ostreatus PC15]
MSYQTPGTFARAPNPRSPVARMTEEDSQNDDGRASGRQRASSRLNGTHAQDHVVSFASTDRPAPSSPKTESDVGHMLEDIKTHLAEQRTFMQQLLNEQLAAMQEQTQILRSISTRQAGQDNSTRPIPQVPLRNAGAWNPLLKSTLSQIAPIMDRWRGGLDTLLIFVGLFSAIVTTFLVESLGHLQVDQGERTNEILTNITEILVSLAGPAGAGGVMVTPTEEVFSPSSDVIRGNIFWSLSLILSLSLAALAVVGRAYLFKLTRPDGDSVTRLTDIHQRWKGAQTLLGPCVEFLPLLLVVPVILFIIGFLDNLIVSALQATAVVWPVLIAAIVACVIVALVGCLMVYSFVHGVTRPHESPFHIGGHHHPAIEDESTVHANIVAYHHTIQRTYDDEVLDQAAAALKAILQNSVPWMGVPGMHGEWPSSVVSALELDTFLHLLSPESSIRCNITVANMLVESEVNFLEKCISPKQKAQLLSALLKAIEVSRWQNRDIRYLLDSPLLSAMAVIVQSTWVLALKKLNLADQCVVNNTLIMGPKSILVLLTANTAHPASHSMDDMYIYNVNISVAKFAHSVLQALLHASSDTVHDIFLEARYTLHIIGPYPTVTTPTLTALSQAFGDDDVFHAQFFPLLLMLLHGFVLYENTADGTSFNRMTNTAISWLLMKPGEWLTSNFRLLSSKPLLSLSSFSDPILNHRLLKTIERLCHQDVPNGYGVAGQFIKNVLNSDCQEVIVCPKSAKELVPLPSILFCQVIEQFLRTMSFAQHTKLAKSQQSLQSVVEMILEWTMIEVLPEIAQPFIKNIVPVVIGLLELVPITEKLELISALMSVMRIKHGWDQLSLVSTVNLIQAYLTVIEGLHTGPVLESVDHITAQRISSALRHLDMELQDLFSNVSSPKIIALCQKLSLSLAKVKL